MGRVLFLIKPDAISCRQEIAIKNFMRENNIKLTQEKKVALNELQAKIICKDYKDHYYFNDLVFLLQSGVCISFIIEGENIIYRLNEVVGDFNPVEAKEGTLRRSFISSVYLFEGYSPIYNSVMFSSSLESAEREIDIIYG